jgi:hypothetical protein
MHAVPGSLDFGIWILVIGFSLGHSSRTHNKTYIRFMQHFHSLLPGSPDFCWILYRLYKC